MSRAFGLWRGGGLFLIMGKIYLRPPKQQRVGYYEFQQECGWCGKFFTKSYVVCPVCGTRGAIKRHAHNSRYGVTTSIEF
jgi:rRNA maturation endonuclease Nob1